MKFTVFTLTTADVCGCQCGINSVLRGVTMNKILVFVHDSLNDGEQVMRPIKVPDEVTDEATLREWLPTLSSIVGKHYKVIVTSDVKDYIILKQPQGRYAKGISNE